MYKYRFMNRKLLILIFSACTVWVLYNCTTKKDPAPRENPFADDKPVTTLPDGKSVLSTIPGNNVFTVQSGGITAYKGSALEVQRFLYAQGRCDLSSTVAGSNYVISMQTAAEELTTTGQAFLNIYFPTSTAPASGSYNITTFGSNLASDQVAVLFTVNRQIAGTIVSKTWRGFSGDPLNITYNLNDPQATFNKIFVENVSNLGDTTITYIVGNAYCQ